MSDFGTNPPKLSEDAVAAIRQVMDEHPSWSYEKVAREVTAAGHTVSAVAVVYVYGATR